jgi:hypothetical protein
MMDLTGLGHRLFLLRKNPFDPASLASGSPTLLNCFSRLTSKLQSGFLRPDGGHVGNKKDRILRYGFFISVDPTGLEPATSSVQMRRSSQMS